MVNSVGQEDWNTRRELSQLQREMDQLRRRAFRASARPRARIFPSIVISATDEKLLVRTEIPGMELEELNISVSGDTLTVEGVRAAGEDLQGGWYHRRERQRGSFSRAIRLPAEVDGAKAEATYVAGILTISLPLREAAKPKEIPVRVVEG